MKTLAQRRQSAPSLVISKALTRSRSTSRYPTHTHTHIQCRRGTDIIAGPWSLHGAVLSPRMVVAAVETSQKEERKPALQVTCLNATSHMLFPAIRSRVCSKARLELCLPVSVSVLFTFCKGFCQGLMYFSCFPMHFLSHSVLE